MHSCAQITGNNHDTHGWPSNTEDYSRRWEHEKFPIIHEALCLSCTHNSIGRSCKEADACGRKGVVKASRTLSTTQGHASMTAIWCTVMLCDYPAFRNQVEGEFRASVEMVGSSARVGTCAHCPTAVRQCPRFLENVHTHTQPKTSI